MEGIRCARAMGRGIGQWIDDLQLLDDRAGPSVRDDERLRILMFRTQMNEMNVQPVDLSQELGQRVQGRLAFAPVVLSRPVPCELLTGRERIAVQGVDTIGASASAGSASLATDPVYVPATMCRVRQELCSRASKDTGARITLASFACVFAALLFACWGDCDGLSEG